MKKFTFERKLFLSVILLGIGHLLWYLTDVGSFVNLAFLLSGLLFFFHPVPPASLSHDPKSRGYVRLAGALLILLGMTTQNAGAVLLFCIQ